MEFFFKPLATRYALSFTLFPPYAYTRFMMNSLSEAVYDHN